MIADEVQCAGKEVFLRLTEDTCVVRRIRPDETVDDAGLRLLADLGDYLARLLAGKRGQLATDPDISPCEVLCWCGKPCATAKLPRHGEFHGCTAVHAEAWIQKAQEGSVHWHPKPFPLGSKPCGQHGCLGYQPKGFA
jgi:hypothetical protein